MKVPSVPNEIKRNTKYLCLESFQYLVPNTVYEVNTNGEYWYFKNSETGEACFISEYWCIKAIEDESMILA
jgi:hypothetical protein